VESVSVKKSGGPVAKLFADNFEIDIMAALTTQLVEKFGQLDAAEMSEARIQEVASTQGVYQLYHRGTLVYVGKADDLQKRVGEHRSKIGARLNISLADMSFKCLYVHRNWTTLAPEATLIKHYKGQRKKNLCEWNGKGFGLHDPGKERDTCAFR
jgi:predicted GIY-YIG superfamily endonuclease